MLVGDCLDLEVLRGNVVPAAQWTRLLSCNAENRTLLAQIIPTVVLGLHVHVQVLRSLLFLPDVVHWQVELIGFHHFLVFWVE